MGFLDKMFNKTPVPIKENIKPSYIFAKQPVGINIQEKLKGLIEVEEVKFPKNLKTSPEQHIVNIAILEKWYKDDAFVNGFIDKFVDAVIGGGFYAKSDDPRAEKIANDFLRDIHFNPVLANWIRNAFITGGGFLEISGKINEVPTELKVLNSKNMYVIRDKFGSVQNYIQWRGSNSKIPPVEFAPYEIAHYAHKVIGESAYGVGSIFPISFALMKKSKLIVDMCTLMTRKANAPIHAKMGRIVPNDPEKDINPSTADMEAFKQKLEWLKNTHEWVTDANVEMNVLNFGNIGEKFSEPIKLINDELFYGSQVPAVLMGQGNIPEGLAKVQLEAFKLRVRALQEEIEKEIENKIFKRLKVANNIAAHIEFEWGIPSKTDKSEELKSMVEILKLYKEMAIGDNLRGEIEKKVADLLDIKLMEEPEKEKQKELTEPQPRVPGQARPKLSGKIEVSELIDETFENKDYTIREWLSFNYAEYLDDIESYINSPSYEKYLVDTFRGASKIEISRGMLSGAQLERLKKTLAFDLRKDKSLNEIAKDIKANVKLKDLVLPQIADKEGNVIKRAVNMKADFRAANIARSEVTKVSNEGALLNFASKGIEKYMWVATISDRTCPECADLDGKVFEIGNGPVPYLHAGCKCAVIPLTAAFEKVKDEDTTRD